MRRSAASHPLLTAALVGVIVGLIGAVLLLRAGDAPGAGTVTRPDRIFDMASIPVRGWYRTMFGWTWKGSRTSELLTLLAVNGALWAMGLTAVMRRSARARRIVLASVVAGTALAGLVWTVGIPDLAADWEGPRGLVLLAQVPGILLLSLNGYDTITFDGTLVGGVYRPGPMTLLLFSLANTLLMACAARVAGFTWRWVRAPMPRRRTIEQI